MTRADLRQLCVFLRDPRMHEARMHGANLELYNEVLDIIPALVDLLDKSEELSDLVCDAAPLAWAAHGDQVSAQAWEKRATELLRQIGEPFAILAEKLPKDGR